MPGEQIETLRLPAAGGSTLDDALADFGRHLAADVLLVVVIGSDAERFVATPPEGAGGLGASALRWLRRRDLITVAVLRGDVSGAGLHLALACDLRLAADDAVISLALDADASPQALGDITARLADLVGYPRALELVVARRQLSGRDAAQIGLANRAVPAVDLEASTHELVSALAATPRAAATELKALLGSWQEDRHAKFAEVVAAVSLARGEA